MYNKLRLVALFITLSRLMESSSPAFPLIIGILLVVFTLTSLGIYFSFGPGSSKLIDPWDHDDD